MRHQNFYQYTLIGFALLAVLGIGAFVYQELFPEYKVYQHAYKDLEKFRSSYTHEKPAPYEIGIKQILLASSTQGLESVDRCISCHTASDLPHFSATRPALDVNGKQVYDTKGSPVFEENPDYVWAKLDGEIALLREPTILEELRARGDKSMAKARLKRAEQLETLKTAAGGTVLQMHPLIGCETRPFQYHALEKYGCVSCHSGNGQTLVATRAHGPVFDKEYEPADDTHKPQFTEKDPDNDPSFARMYNHKPGHELVFQTTPLLAGPLVVAKCVQCHQSTNGEVRTALDKFSHFTDQKKLQIAAMEKGLQHEKEALASLLKLQKLVEEKGREGAIETLTTYLEGEALSSSERGALQGQLAYLKAHEECAVTLDQEIGKITHSNSLENKQQALAEGEAVLKQFQATQTSLKLLAQDQKTLRKMETNVDRLIGSYQRGKELYLSQGCYACHRIAGYSRSSVGPELTKAGNNYPWYVKESIVWPQADLPSSTMPNFRLDHEELSDLMAFLMAQKGETKSVSEVDYQIRLSDWDQGAKMPWEEAIAPTQMHSVRAAQLVFASEGCASCHKLQGFQTNEALKTGKKEWFCTVFPEQIAGTRLAKLVEERAEEIDAHIIPAAHSDGIVEEIEQTFPGLIESFYTNFKFASRAYNTAWQQNPEKLAAYKERLHKVLMLYIQEYGLGRDIAPHLNWSGVFRDDAWLLGHFRNPSAYTSKSIMPVLPFDETKFYMLNHMLHVLGKANREKLQERWREGGFNPPLAYEQLCSSCHGTQRQGNGVVAEWIYPIPKNLRNPVFLRNLTRERAIDSITHGVKGTPMPPWGETIAQTELGDTTPVLSNAEIAQLVDWLYQNVQGDDKTDYEKWHYTPSDLVHEMEQERAYLQPIPTTHFVEDYFDKKANPLRDCPDQELYYIRQTYYTPENLESARQFYSVNCASCHGKEGTGTGLRATSMVEAKPRMFTNLPWIRTRDDLRLLRSIKYGVPGTSMVAWGDQTTAEQRMQLVMFIRDFSRATLLGGDLQELLQLLFNPLAIETARAEEYKQLEALKADLHKREHVLLEQTQEKQLSSEKIGALYAEVVQLKKEVHKRDKTDALFRDLISSMQEEKSLYASIGAQVIASGMQEEGIQHFFSLLRAQIGLYAFENGKLQLKEAHLEQAEHHLHSLLQTLEAKIASLQEKIASEEGKLDHSNTQLDDLKAEQTTWTNLKAKLLVYLADAAVVRQHQKALLSIIQAGEKR